jgi:broad specificity polyphosphatase/5'/3'-nucleotidase SurE
MEERRCKTKEDQSKEDPPEYDTSNKRKSYWTLKEERRSTTNLTKDNKVMKQNKVSVTTK